MKCFVLVIVLGCAPLLMSQGKSASSNPVSDAVRTAYTHQSENLEASAAEMPAEKYSYKPTPAQMSFGRLTMHIAESNFFMCSRIGGGAAPESPDLKETDSKDKLTKALNASFDYCRQVLTKTDDSDLSAKIKLWGGREVTRAAAMIALTNDWADHYATAANYLRLNGLLPPTAQKKK